MKRSFFVHTHDGKPSRPGAVQYQTVMKFGKPDEAQNTVHRAMAKKPTPRSVQPKKRTVLMKKTRTTKKKTAGNVRRRGWAPAKSMNAEQVEQKRNRIAPRGAHETNAQYMARTTRRLGEIYTRRGQDPEVIGIKTINFRDGRTAFRPVKEERKGVPTIIPSRFHGSPAPPKRTNKKPEFSPGELLTRELAVAALTGTGKAKAMQKQKKKKKKATGPKCAHGRVHCICRYNKMKRKHRNM